MKLKKALSLVLFAAGILFAQEVDVIHISQAEALKSAKESPQPDYPPMARQLRLQGDVKVQAHISESGTVEEARPLTGNAVLALAAVSATRRWKFAPILTDGKPRKVITELSFSFKL